MKDRLKNIFEETECLPEDLMWAYLDDKLDAKAKHQVELHLASCELCADAVEGMRLFDNREKTEEILKEVGAKLGNNPISINRKRNWLNYRWSIAAAVVLLLVSGIVFLFLDKEKDKGEKLFSEQFEPYQEKKAEQKPDSNLTKDEKLANKETSKNDQGLVADIPANEQKPINGVFNGDKSIALKPAEERNKANANPPDAAPTQPKVNSGYMAQKNANAEMQYEKSEDYAVAIPPKSPMADEVKLEEKNKDKSTYRNGKAGDSLIGVVSLTDRQSLSDKEGWAMHNKEALGGNNNLSYAPPTVPTKNHVELKEKKKSKGESKQKALPAPNINSNVGNVDNNNNEITTVTQTATFSWTNGNSFLDSAMNKYKLKDYQGAIVLFEKVLVNDPNNYYALFYSGVTYLSVNNPDKAIANLNQVLNNVDGEYFEASQWYKALAFIKKGNKKEAKTLLKNLESSNGNFKIKAQETLKELK